MKFMQEQDHKLVEVIQLPNLQFFPHKSYDLILKKLTCPAIVQLSSTGNTSYLNC